MFATARHTIVRSVAAVVGTVVFAGLCLGAAAAPASADTLTGRTEAVHYSDLNLSHVAGRNALETRIRVAARKVCANGGADIRARAEETRCIASAIAAAERPANLSIASR